MSDACGNGEVGEEELAFQRLYGPWRPVDPLGAQQLMRGYDGFWWVAGGHAIEAFTGLPRRHEDIDVVVFRRDLAALREHFDGRFHLWSAGGGALRPLNEQYPEPHEEASQLWLREHALAPWLMDCLLNPDVDGRWQSRRDPDHVAPLDEVTWVHDDGVRYLNPEIALLFKARLHRPKDQADLEAAWPRLEPCRQRWLAESVRRLHPDHPWNRCLTGG